MGEYSTFRRQDSGGSLVEDFLYIYGPGNYRILVWDGKNLKRHFTFRDLNAKILREFDVTGFGAGAVWNQSKDFLHGPSGLIATRNASGLIKYAHHDHLGTPRLVTSSAGFTVAQFHYYPYGAQANTFNPNDEHRYKFTGHERDRNGEFTTQPGATDYMLGRTYAYPFQRFMQVDPARDGWNLYGYVRGNPVKFVDLTGTEGAQIRMNQRVQMFLEGTKTKQQLLDNYTADAVAATAGAAIVLTGGLAGPYVLGAALNPEVSIPATTVAAGLLGVEGAGLIPKPSLGPLKNLAGALDETAQLARTANPRVSSVNPNDLQHIFGQPKHRLGGLVEAFGSKENVFTELLQATKQATQGTTGRFETIVRIGGADVTVRGAIVKGQVRIGTAFVP